MRTSDNLYKGLGIDIPACVPVYDQYPSDSVRNVEPLEYRYISLLTTLHKNPAAYVVHDYDFASPLEEGDIILVDRNQDVNSGDNIAGFIDGVLHVGRLHIISNELWLENRAVCICLQNNQVAGIIIKVEKSHKNLNFESKIRV